MTKNYEPIKYPSYEMKQEELIYEKKQDDEPIYPTSLPKYPITNYDKKHYSKRLGTEIWVYGFFY